MEDKEEVQIDAGVSGEAPAVEAAETPTEPAATEKETPAPESEPDFSKMDPNKLPPELLTHYKGMQSAFTKKMQALQEATEGLSQHRERLSLMDRAIQGDKQAQEALARIAGAKLAAEAAPAEDQIPETFVDTKSLTSFFEQRFQKMLQEQMQKVLPQVMQPVQQMQQEAQVKAFNAEIGRLKATYPDFESKISSMIEAKQRAPGLSMEDAYKLVSFQPKVPAAAITQKPGVRPKSVSESPKAGISFEDAFALAEKQLKGR